MKKTLIFLMCFIALIVLSVKMDVNPYAEDFDVGITAYVENDLEVSGDVLIGETESNRDRMHKLFTDEAKMYVACLSIIKSVDSDTWYNTRSNLPLVAGDIRAGPF